jgi:hypothetical protein
MYDILPRELIQMIYEFDPTYREKYNGIMKNGFNGRFENMMIKNKFDFIFRQIAQNEIMSYGEVKELICYSLWQMNNYDIVEYLYDHSFVLSIDNLSRDRRLYKIFCINNKTQEQHRYLYYFDRKKKVETKTVNNETVHYYGNNGDNNDLVHCYCKWLNF